MADEAHPRLSRRKKVLFALPFVAIGALVAWLATAVARAHAIYEHVKGRERAVAAELFRVDPELGVAPALSARGPLVFPVGGDIEARTDRNGFRIPVSAALDDATAGPRPFVLALGCSFTFGDGVRAEDTFAHEVARVLSGTELNAGGCGWGLAQMLIEARRKIPALAPEVVIVQSSPWLATRAVDPLYATPIGALPQAYFVDAPDGVAVHAPLFEASLDRGMGAYRDSPRGMGDTLSFLAGHGAPLVLRDDFERARIRVESRLGLVPRPTSELGRVVASVQGEIGKLCAAKKSKLVFLSLWADATPAARDLCIASGGVFVDGQAALWANLPSQRAAVPPDGTSGRRSAVTQGSKDDDFRRAYGIWRGSPPRLIDGHPNEAAHHVLARAVLDALH